MGIKYNNADLISIEDTVTGLQMIDKFSRIKDERRIEPLDALDNVLYPHRYMYDEYNLQIGDTYFMIPPEFIMVSSESTSQSLVTLRQENTQKMKAGHHKRTILIDLVFNGLEQLNGYAVPGPEGTYYVDGLRQLLAQFKCTPFLPISNELVNGMYGIFTVALQSITMSTMQGFPNAMTAQITLQEVNMYPYLEMPDVCFKYMIDWDLFRFYYQRFLTETHVYKKLQSLPANSEHNRFKISVLSDAVFNSEKATESNMLSIICDEYKVTEEDSNYITWLDSAESDVVITAFQCGYSNILTNIQLSDISSPTIQYIGGMDTIYSITMETTDYSVVQALEQCQISNDLLIRNNAKVHSVGFVKLESELVSFTGSLFVLIDSVVTNTVPGFPGLYNVQMNCIAYDIAQSSREQLHGFRPFDCEDCDDNDFNPDHVHGGDDERYSNQTIEQSIQGLEIKIKQDNYAEWKIRTSMEVYPDLHLPTYNEVDAFIRNCIDFRKKNNLTKLPYTKYPKNPMGMLHGSHPGNNISVKNVSHGIAYTDDIDTSKLEYDIYVDPDFYVFYSCSYLSFYLSELEEGNDTYYGYQPKHMKSYSKTREVIHTPNYNGETYATDLIEAFITCANSFIGHTYKWGAEGEVSDAKGLCFDCSGFVTYLLQKIGAMPKDEGRLTVDTIPSSQHFIEVPWNQMQRGDVLCNSDLTHTVVYEGNNSIVHAANSSPYPIGGVKKDTQYFKNGRCFRPKAFIKTSKASSATNTTGFHVTQDFVDMVKDWEGFLGTAEPRDGGIDIGYGFHNTYFDGTQDVKITSGMTMSKEDAEHYLTLELESMIPKTLSKLEQYGWNTSDFTNNQVLALTSYFYNRGFHNKNADSLLVVSKTIEDIGNNLPLYWGTASYAKQGLINRRNKEKTLFFSDSSSVVSQYTLTTSEFEAICKVVAAETLGEDEDAQRAVAQVIYDRLTHPEKKFGGLSNILNGEGQFKTNYQGVVEHSVADIVREVFTKGKKHWNDAQIWYFLTPDANNAAITIAQRDEVYDRIGEAGIHVFWGAESAGSNIKYSIISDPNIGTASSNELKEAYTLLHNAKTIKDIKRFAEPVLAKTEAMIYDDNWAPWNNETNKTNAMEYLNDGLNICNTMFCDEYQYSARGRLVRAFPTYLFCILDDNAQWYDGRKLWTNYYVHRSVVDIAVHGTNDMPTETATLTVTNSYHNLDRTQGGLNDYSIANDEGYAEWVRKFYKATGLLLGLGPKLTDKLIKLQQVIYSHAKLREGARVHLRIGYGSDPLGLAPVMNGHVSDVALGDQITIVVTSDGHELIQHVTSAKEKDTNNGLLGLFGLGEDQEASNIIAEVMAKRESWCHYLAEDTFEGSAYGIEHFGLYFNQKGLLVICIAAAGGIVGGATIGMKWGGAIGAAIGSVVPVVGTALGTGIGVVLGGLLGAGIGALTGVLIDGNVSLADFWNGVQEQYDIMKNIYKASYNGEHYIYSSDFGYDHEQNFVFNKYNMTPWDVFQVSTQQIPEFIVKPSYHQFDSRLYFGLPFWMEKYRYNYLNGIVYEECKSAAQVHLLDCTNIIDNQVKVTSKFSNTNTKVMYTRGGKVVSTPTIHSDDTIDFAYQKTQIIDSPLVQDALGPDLIYEVTFYSLGEDAARRVGVSNLLYGWQQQYQGQLILTGCPGIKAHDYVMIHDSFADVYGLAIVREVTHSFSLNTGFTTSLTLGMIGFHTEDRSGMIQVCQSLLGILNCFSSYIETRRTLRNNYEQYLNLFSEFEIMRDKLTSAINNNQKRDSTANIVNGAFSVVELAQAGVLAYTSFKFAKNLKNLVKAKKFVSTAADAFKTAKTVYKSAKGITKTWKAIKTGGAVLGLSSAGLGTLAWFAVTCVIDALLEDVFDWFDNRNVCVLLPLWWDGYPFVSGTKNGENILLIKQMPTSQNTGGEQPDFND